MKFPARYSMKYLLGYTTVPSKAVGKKIATILLKNNLAACVNILPNALSMFQWKDKIDQQKEFIMIFKTTERRWGDAETLIKKHHAYECPCIVAIEISKGSKSFFDWIQESTIPAVRQKRVRGK